MRGDARSEHSLVSGCLPGVEPTVQCHGAAIAGCASCGEWRPAIALLREAQAASHQASGASSNLGYSRGISGKSRQQPLLLGLLSTALKDCLLLLSSTTAMQTISSGERKSDTCHDA